MSVILHADSGSRQGDVSSTSRKLKGEQQADKQ